MSCRLCQIGASSYVWQDEMLMHVGIGWGPLIAVFICPDSFSIVHLVEGGQPVCMLLWAVQLGLWCWFELLVAIR